MKCYDDNLLVKEVDKDDRARVLQGSNGTVYYIGGWPIIVMTELKAEMFPVAAVKFVASNTATSIKCPSLADLPMQVVDSWEMHFGKMHRITSYQHFSDLHHSHELPSHDALTTAGTAVQVGTELF